MDLVDDLGLSRGSHPPVKLTDSLLRPRSRRQLSPPRHFGRQLQLECPGCSPRAQVPPLSGGCRRGPMDLHRGLDLVHEEPQPQRTNTVPTRPSHSRSRRLGATIANGNAKGVT